MSQVYPTRRKKLKPAGHSATIEALIQPAIVIGSTLMSAIAAYVLALDEITRVLNHRGTPSDVFIIVLCAGMGFLVDMAIIVSATRYKMHTVRADPRERHWRTLAMWVLGIGLASETMTLFYFFVHLSAAAFPGPMVRVADVIHAALAVARAFLPPVVIAYFAAGVLPVMFDRADRNREIKSRTSSNIMLLIDRLSEVYDTDDKAEMLRALGGQLMLDTYATYDETARTSETHQLQRDAKLLAHLARIHRLDWDTIAAEVAPDMRPAPPAYPALPRPEYAPPTAGHPTHELDEELPPDDGPDGDDDGPRGGGGVPLPAPRRLPREFVPVSAVNSPAPSRNGRASATRQVSDPEAWDWKELAEYTVRAYGMQLGKPEALEIIKDCDTCKRDARRPGRPFVASRKQLEQKVRLHFGLRGVTSPKRTALSA